MHMHMPHAHVTCPTTCPRPCPWTCAWSLRVAQLMPVAEGERRATMAVPSPSATSRAARAGKGKWPRLHCNA
eukprot:817777-Prymnesium_polylepis.1